MRPDSIFRPSIGLFLLFATFISGCQSTAEPTPTVIVPAELKRFPTDAAVTGKDIVDMQLALADRNLYLSSLGNIKHLSRNQCGLEVSAHRGDFRQPESSATAITHALIDNFDSLEIDVMLLDDGTWVNHHDKYSGRASVYYTGKRQKIEDLSLKYFKRLKLRDKQTNELLDQRPLTALETFKFFAAYQKVHQKLNVEIKSEANGEQLKRLDDMLRLYIGQGRFYYSSMDADALHKLRGINPQVYIGFIQGAHPDSIAKLKSDLRRGAQNDELYRENRDNIEAVGNFGSRRYGSKYRDFTSSKALYELYKDFGSNSGLHLDIRRYAQVPVVKSRAHELGMKVLTYTINGTDYHQSRLLALQKTSLPDGIIVDTSPYRICERLFGLSRPNKSHIPSSDLGRYISSLPADADFDRFEEMLGYASEGYYISLSKGLKLIKSKPKPVVKSHGSAFDEFGFPIIKDEQLETRSETSIIIVLPGAK